MVLDDLSSSWRRNGHPASFSSSSSSLRLRIVGLVLSTVVLLAAGEKRSRYGERVSHDFELSGLRDLETCSLSNRAMKDPSKVRSNPDQIARRITTLAQRCLEYIDDLKDEYTQHLLLMSWRKADAREPPKLCEELEDGCPKASEVYLHEPYLAVVPAAIPTQPNLNAELLKAYSLLQHYDVALTHLTLDQHELFEETTYRKYIKNITLEIENLLCRLLIDITGQGLSPDIETTKKLTQEIYRRQWIPRQREKRDFVFLRDTRAGLQYIKDTFSIFVQDK